MDELMPLTQRGKNSFGGLGATIVDSLDTLWLLDMKDAFKAARDWVADSLQFDRCMLCAALLDLQQTACGAWM